MSVTTLQPSKATLIGEDPHCSTCGTEVAIGGGARAACMCKGKLFCPACYRDAKDPDSPKVKAKRQRRGNWKRFAGDAQPPKTGQLIAAFLKSLSLNEKAFALQALLNMARQDGHLPASEGQPEKTVPVFRVADFTYRTLSEAKSSAMILARFMDGHSQDILRADIPMSLFQVHETVIATESKPR